ncbi:MAG TPA: DUF6644 family protein [Caulobacteraceae bacterium]|nr:DUF6644 family protein [Caulobacteraceae bacterium]
MSLYHQFEALEATPIGDGIKNSIWLFPAIEAVHLLALSLLGGAVLMLDLRLLGVGLTSQLPSSVERETRPWLVGALAVMVVTGSLLGLSEAVKLYDKQAFWVKMIALATALLFTFGVKAPLTHRGPAWMARPLAVASLALWLTVAIAGRWIGFS